MRLEKYFALMLYIEQGRNKNRITHNTKLKHFVINAFSSTFSLFTSNCTRFKPSSLPSKNSEHTKYVYNFVKHTWVNSSSPLLLSSQSDLFRITRCLHLGFINWWWFFVRDALFVRLYGVRDDRTFCRRIPGESALCKTYDTRSQTS